MTTRFAINVIEDARHRILLLKRAPNQRLAPDLWGFPGGHIETHESAQQCALRELNEEIGRDHDITLVRQIGPIRDSLYGGVYRIWLYHHRWHAGVIALNHEHRAFAWVTESDYRSYDVMDGIDEDLYLLKIWPRSSLNQNKLDTALAIRRRAGEPWD